MSQLSFGLLQNLCTGSGEVCAPVVVVLVLVTEEVSLGVGLVQSCDLPEGFVVAKRTVREMDFSAVCHDSFLSLVTGVIRDD